MNQYIAIFIIIALGYLLGRIKIKGISFGSSGVLFVALAFGHFNIVAAPEVKNIGLICFVTSVGIIAGTVFLSNFKKKALTYIVLGIVTILVGAGACIAIIQLTKIPTALALGLMNGALTSTPGLAAAMEATGDNLTSVGYGIAYPFGVLGVVLFVQIIPILLRTDIKAEVSHMEVPESEIAVKKPAKITVEPFGFFPFALAVVCGILLGNISIPLPGGAHFSLGMSGGPLMMGLLVGALGKVGPVSLEVNKATMKGMREFGLLLFLVGAGTEAGQGFVEVAVQYGWSLLLYGAVITIVPMVAVYLLARKVFRLETMNSLGMICGGMTSTPALGTLISVAGSDAVATAYAATYPIALVMVIISSQLIAVWF